MKLQQIITKIIPQISGIVCNSKQVQPGQLFIALAKDPEKLALHCREALHSGARFILADKQQAIYLPSVIVKNFADHTQRFIFTERLAEHLPELLRACYGTAIDQLHIIGVTGTNGKSSVSYYIFQLIHQLGLGKAGLINTVFWGIADQRMPSNMTTPDTCTLYQQLHWMVQHQVTHVVMEVSSHALAQNRIAGIKITTAVFTNLSHDHLDYHGSMAAYAASKKKLFIRDDLMQILINQDDTCGKEWLEQWKKNTQKRPFCYSYGLHPAADFYTDGTMLYCKPNAMNHHSNNKDAKESYACALYHTSQADHQSSIVRINQLAAIATVMSIASDPKPLIKQLVTAVAQLQSVPGRLERICWQQRTIYIDYAHTPDALGKVLQDLKRLPHRQLCCLFGCGGNRDKEKRPLMGYTAGLYADKIILTSDNPRNEQPEAIIAAIQSGMNLTKTDADVLPTRKVEIMTDRAKAIHTALTESAPGDIILIAGKGHERTQEIHGVFYPFYDKEQVETYISRHVMTS